MTFKLAAACAFAILALAGPALADGSVKATLETPVAKPTKLIAAHAVFNCDATTCVAVLAPDDASDAYACRDLAKQVGHVTAYAEYKPLDEKGLAKCNAGIAPPKAAAAK